MRWPRSDTLMPSCSLMTFFSSAIWVICVLAPFFVGFFFLPRMGMVTRPQTMSDSSCLETLVVVGTRRACAAPRSLFLETSTSSRPRPR